MKSPYLNPIISGIELVLNKTSVWSVILPLGVGLFFIRKLSTDSYLIVGMVALATIPQFLNVIPTTKEFKSIVYNIYTPVEFLIVFFLFRDKLSNPLLKKVFISVAILYLFSSGIFIVFFNLSKSFISEWVCASNLVYTVWVLLILIDQYHNENTVLNKSSPFFWYMLGIFLYAPCTLLIFSLWDYLMKNPHSALKNLWLIHHVFNISLYVLFTVGLITENKKRATRTH